MRGATTRTALPLLLFAALGCGGSATAPSGTSDGGGGKRFLSIGTAPVVGGFYLVGGALAEVLNQNPGEMNWEVTAEATKGSQENIRRLDQGEMELAISNSAITYFAARGEAGWDKPYDVRVIMTLAPNVAQFITKRDSDIRTMADLRGKRVATGPAGAGFEQFVGPLLAAHGLGFEDFTPVNSTQGAAVDMLADGSIAAAFLGGAVPHPAITQAAATLDIRFVPYSDEARRRLSDEYAFFWPVEVPPGTYRGIDEAFPGLNVGSMHLITSATQSDDLVYAVTRTLWENRADVVERAAAGRSINPENVVRDTGTEFHPGAIRFYREIGIWPEGDSAPAGAAP